MADEPPLQPLVVPQGAIPTAPPTSAAVQARSNPFYLGGLPTGESGNYIKDWFTQFHKSHGITPDLPNLSGMEARRVLPPLGPYRGGEPITPGPVGVGGPTEIRLEHLLNPDKLAQITGLKDSPFGTVARSLGTAWSSAMELDKAATTVDPDYDVFRDRQIQDAGFGNQIDLFLGSTSRRATAERIEQIRARQREAEWIERGSGTLQLTNMAGGLFGDPLNYLPVTMGVKTLQLARKAAAGTLTGAELKFLSQQPALYGALADGARGAAYTAAFGVAEQMLLHQMDPTIPAEIGLEMLIPTALAGSLSMLTGATARWSGRTLAHEVRGRGFLASEPPRVFSGMPEDARTMAEAYASKVVAVPPSNNGAFPKSSLATDYGPTRISELKGSTSLGGGFYEPPTLRHTADFGDFIKGNKLFDEKGGPFMVYHTSYAVFDEFDPGKLGKFTKAKSAEMGFFFSGKPETSGSYAPFIPDPKFPAMADWGDQFSRRFTSLVTRSPQGVNRNVAEYFEHRAAMKAGGRPNMRPTYIRMTNPYIVTDIDVRVTKAADAEADTFLMDMEGKTWVNRDGKWREPFHPLTSKRQTFTDEVTEIEVMEGLKRRMMPASEGKLWDKKPGIVPYQEDAAGNDWMAQKKPDGTLVWKKMSESRQASEARHYASPDTPSLDELTHSVGDADRRNLFYSDEIEEAKRLGHDGVVIRNTYDSASGKQVLDDIYVVFDPDTQIRGFDQRWDVTPNAQGLVEGIHQPGSVGAMLTPQSLAYQQSVLLAQGRLMPTGIGIEKIPFNTVQRAFQGASVAAMRLQADLVSTGGVQTVGNSQGIANLPPLTSIIDMTWNRPLVQVLRETNDAWSDYRKAMASGQEVPPHAQGVDGRGDAARIAERIGIAAKDLIAQGEKPLSYGQFNARVGLALRRGDVDAMDDAAAPYVQRAAAKHRAHYEHTRKEALDSGIFEEAYQDAVYQAMSDLRALKKEARDTKIRAHKEKWTPDQLREAEEVLLARTEDAQFKFRQTEDALKSLRDNGPTLNGTAPSYRPRIYNVQALLDGEQEFIDITVGWLQSRAMRAQHPLETEDAARIAKQIHEIVAKQNPVFERGDLQALFRGVAAPGSAMARSFTIPDELIGKFLVDDAETLLRYHTKQMGTAIEMKKRFGSLDLADEIAEIERDYRNAIEQANAGSPVATEQAKKLAAQMKTAIADAQATRDKIYGTYGASPDPHRWQSRTIRMAKQFTNLTLLGMSGITALGDLVRPVMTEGLEAVYGYGFKSLISEARSTILKMNRMELELEGNGMELFNNVRALSAADTGDVFGSRGKFEHGMNAANQWMFVANGLNMVNQVDKEWARLSIGGRVNRVLLDLLGNAASGEKTAVRFSHLSDDEIGNLIVDAEKKLSTSQPSRFDTRMEAAQELRADIVDWQRELAARGSGGEAPRAMSQRDIGRFAAAGIDEAMALRIALQLKIYKIEFGQGRGAMVMPNTTEWTDDLARIHYRSAMNQMVNRTVPTPGIGDRPNFFSTEIGGLMMQYRSFGVGALVRGAYSGLQEGGNQFWYGAAAAVGFAVLLNEVRSQLFYGKSSFDKPLPAILADGIDRSSILGIFGDANRAVETLSGQRMGLRPMIGASNPVDPSFKNIVGTVAGPSAQQATRVASVASDLLRGHPTAETYRDWRSLTPGGTLAVADPLFDAIFPTDYPKRVPKPGRPQQPAG